MDKEKLLEEFNKLNKNSSVKDLQEYTMLAMCVATDIDLFEAFKAKEEINFNREWK